MRKDIIVVVIGIAVLVGIGAFMYMTPVPQEAPQTEKLNIVAVCESALAYMSFPDGESAQAFVEACIRGEHPEVIERYKADMGLGDGAAI